MAIFNKGNTMAKETSTTVISQGAKLKGDFNLVAKLHIEGEIEGTVNSSTQISVGKSGLVKGEIVCSKFILNGKFEGKIESDILEITNGGMLNGEIVIIKGNHDKVGEKFRIIEYEGYKFMLIHNPDSSLTFNFDGWVIHGHHHGNYLDEYPFINPFKKRINVSVEVLDYKPVSLDLIIKLIEKEKFIKTIKGI